MKSCHDLNLIKGIYEHNSINIPIETKEGWAVYNNEKEIVDHMSINEFGYDVRIFRTLEEAQLYSMHNIMGV